MLNGYEDEDNQDGRGNQHPRPGGGGGDDDNGNPPPGGIPPNNEQGNEDIEMRDSDFAAGSPQPYMGVGIKLRGGP